MLFFPESCFALVHGIVYFYLIALILFCYFGIHTSCNVFFVYSLILYKKLTGAEKFFADVLSVFLG